ncbi:MAG TPA: hypothetical protein VMI72_16550 [Roseiarcus sp.]|nr:hypothetical protein [Roseiarcus sp.]
MGELDEEGVARADARIEEIVAKSSTVVPPSVKDFDLAKRGLATFATG